MSVLSQAAAPVWTDLVASPRVGILARALLAARRAIALRLSQWAQSNIQQEAQAMRETARSVAVYDLRMANELHAAADRHEWAAR